MGEQRVRLFEDTKSGRGVMLRFHQLRENPVSVTFRDGNGATFTVVATRFREGIVKMTCQCQIYSEGGWCRHCLGAFSDQDVFENKKHREAFEQLVGRTYIEDAAAKLTKALDDFARAYRQMKTGRLSDLNPAHLKDFAERTEHASISANGLALAVEEFINEAAARQIEARSSSTGRALSGVKESIIEVIRRALAKDQEWPQVL